MDGKAVIAELERLRSGRCIDCAAPLCAHTALMSLVLGFKNAPRCLACLAKGLDRDIEGMRKGVLEHIQNRDCFRAGWEWADRQEGGVREWDAGDMGCGDLVLELRLRLQDMKPGQVIRVIARDPGAPADMPAWCGLTGHALLEASHPVYVIRKKEK